MLLFRMAYGLPVIFFGQKDEDLRMEMIEGKM